MSSTSGSSGRPRRRWLRFSLRSLFILVTLSCVALGWWAKWVHNRQAAIEALHKYRAQVEFAQATPNGFGGVTDYDAPMPGPAWLRRLMGEYAFVRVDSATIPSSYFGWEREQNAVPFLQHLPELRSLNLAEVDLPRDGLVYMSGLDRLEELDLHGVAVRQAGAEHLAGLRNLKTLDLSETDIASEDLQHLSGMTQLKRLDLSNTAVDDTGMAALAHLSALEDLQLTNTNVTDAGLRRLALLTKLKGLGLAGTQVEGVALQDLECDWLDELDLRYAPVKDDALSSIAKFRRLRRLNLEGCWELSDEAVVDFQAQLAAGLQLNWQLSRGVEGFPLTGGAFGGMRSPEVSLPRMLERVACLKNLRRLDLHDLDVHDEDLVHVSGLRSLEYLSLAGTEISSDGLRYLVDLSRLKTLILRDTQVNDASLEYLSGLTALLRLDLTNTRVGDAGLLHVWQLSQLADLRLGGTDLHELGFEHFRSTGLERLDLRFTSVDDGVLGNLWQFRQLEKVDLRGCWAVSAEVVDGLRQSPWNEAQVEWEAMSSMGCYLSCNSRDISFHQVVLSLSHAEHLDELKIWDSEICGEDFAYLEPLLELRSMSFHGCQFDSEALPQLVYFPQIEKLCFVDCDLGDEVIEHLARCPHLRKLTLEGCFISEEGAAHLRKALPRCRIEHSIRDPDDSPYCVGCPMPIVG